MTAPGELIALFSATAAAVRAAVDGIAPAARRDRTERPGQYALDLVADAVAITALQQLPVRIVSEESGVHERPGADITVVVDPVDGSTNCARGLAYWATSLCALDRAGPVAALVVNQATGQQTIAVRGEGATRDGERLSASRATRVQQAVVGLGGYPRSGLRWKQSRAFGCCSLMLCDVAAGGLDGYLDAGAYHAPWDYLGGLLACTEAGATVFDVKAEPLVTDALESRRQLVAAGTRELAVALAEGLA